MYPNLLLPLLIIVGVFAAGLGFVALFRPVSRRLAARQLTRRRSEAVLAIVGATLGTAIIVGSLVVGDTLNFSVRQAAYQTLGPVDERVMAPDAGTGEFAARTLAPLRRDPAVDGVLTVHVDQAAAFAAGGGRRLAEPRVLAWSLDYRDAARFGSAGGASGLDVSPPAPGQALVNQPLADSLDLRAGSRIMLLLYGSPQPYTVARVLPAQGLAGAGFGSTVNRNVFLPQGALGRAAYLAGTRPQTVTFVSNRGGVEGGAALTTQVSSRMRHLLAYAGIPATVETPKRSVLDAAKKTGDTLGSLFLMIGSFSIIAGALLLVNIFTMLAEERRSQLGMLRAVGMKRSRLVESFSLEGASYAVAAIVPGIVLGLGVGWAVALISAQIFRTWSAEGSGLDIKFAVTPTSIANGTALGLVIALATIVGASVRISRFNVIAAIRDLPPTPTQRMRRLTTWVATALALLLAVAAVPAVAASKAETTLLLPSLAAALFTPALRRVLPVRWAITATASFVLLWTLLAPVLRPDMFDNPSMAIWVVQGTLLAFSAVALISQNQTALLRPARPLLDRPSQTGLALKLATAYPLAKRFRTGATLIMYTLITLVLVLLVEVNGVISASIDENVARSTAGYDLRVDMNPADAPATLAALRTGPFAGDITAVTPLTTAAALATDPGHRTTAPVRALAVGVPNGSMPTMHLDSRLPRLTTDRQVWRLVAENPRYVLLDAFFNSSGGPPAKYYAPGDTFTIVDPRTGQRQQRVIAGILASAMIFYPDSGSATSTYPIVSSAQSVRGLFGSGAQTTSAVLRTRAGVDPVRLGTALQGRYLAASLVSTPIAANARAVFAANTAFFRLMQGFLALGLLIGITGLGVMMIRAVRERRRTIGVLRALGFPARTVQRSFLAESTFIAAEGVLLGAVLGVLTTWLMYQKSAMFNGVRTGFPIEWWTIITLAAATLVASLAATLTPARRAARVLPALAVRVAE
ncbi:MAG TPA: FtsX-like permease family protein [Jatrophihabitans sp.]|nr:FtsX-like permease family protein [Jatrophihabitans sp.]